MIRTRLLLVPFAFVAMGALVLCLSGCGKESGKPAEPPASSPAVYMNDPVFRKALADKRRELQAIVKERAPLVKRMEELVRSNRQDLAVLQKIPEWTNLHARVVALNAKYEETRQRQLKIFRDRVNPVDADHSPRRKVDADYSPRQKKADSVPVRHGEDAASTERGATNKKISK